MLEAGGGGLDVVDYEGNMAQAGGVQVRVPDAFLRHGTLKLDDLQRRLAVGRRHHDHGAFRILQADDAVKMQKILDMLEDLDDVQDVYTSAVIEEA